ncbi:MAG: PfkB family carbohydrate kinase [Bacteroidota bacterium]
MPISGLFLGLTTLDLQYHLPHYPAPNSKHKVAETDISLGGPAANAAATFAYLGGNSTFCTVVGQHALTSFFADQFQTYQIEAIDLSPHSPHLPTLASVLTSADNGDRTIVTNIRQVSELIYERIPKDKAWDIILVDGFHMEAAIELARWGRNQQIPVVLDGGSWKEGMADLLAYVDIAICSADFQLPGGGDVFRYIAERSVSAIAQSRGGKEIISLEGEKRSAIAVPQVEVVDTLGAGDVLHGAFCWYYAQSGDFADALRRAAEVASESCRYFGAKTWMKKGL